MVDERESLYIPFAVQDGYELPTTDVAIHGSRSATVRLDRPQDPVWPLVHQTLEDRAWDFRTVEGIGRATGLAEPYIEQLIHIHGDEVRTRTLSDGRVGYTLRSREKGWREKFSDFMDLVYP